eukprot:Hpha_TRINITY_DN3111_c0_g1::TRINITY_DN3111_c0_g1_i1::g.96658::m.96658
MPDAGRRPNRELLRLNDELLRAAEQAERKKQSKAAARAAAAEGRTPVAHPPPPSSTDSGGPRRSGGSNHSLANLRKGLPKAIAARLPELPPEPPKSDPGGRPAPRSPTASSVASGVSCRSRFDDPGITVEECMSYIQQHHRSWDSATKGIDISDYKTEPAVSEPGSTRSFVTEKKPRADDASSVASFASGVSGVSRRSTATNATQGDSFPPGIRVVAKGLRDERGLNGAEGAVVSSMPGENDKVLVDFGMGIGRRAIKPQNLTRLRLKSGGAAAEGPADGLAVTGIGTAAGAGAAAVSLQRKSSAGAPARAGGAARPHPGARPPGRRPPT